MCIRVPLLRHDHDAGRSALRVEGPPERELHGLRVVRTKSATKGGVSRASVKKGKKPVEVLEKKPAVETKLPIASELPMKTTEKKTKKRPLVFEVLDVKEVTPKKISRFM
ncbi:hypothetical protein M3Y99_00551800 [Aphelenchoides fujianensis]|nr:hypothetical protein M3Y99_00551800 [Aphelenchoides fujianensis]